MLIADNAIAPDYEPIDRPHNQQSAPTATALTTSAASTLNQQSANLSAPLSAIVEYAKCKDEYQQGKSKAELLFLSKLRLMRFENILNI